MKPGELHEVSKSIGGLQAQVEMLVRMQSDNAMQYQQMHRDTQGKIDGLADVLHKRVTDQDSRLGVVEHKLSTQKGAMAVLAVIATFIGAWAKELYRAVMS